jgi:hypothetical protein
LVCVVVVWFNRRGCGVVKIHRVLHPISDGRESRLRGAGEGIVHGRLLLGAEAGEDVTGEIHAPLGASDTHSQTGNKLRDKVDQDGSETLLTS